MKHFFTFLSIVFFAAQLNAQTPQTMVIDTAGNGDFTSVTEAINDLNTNGVPENGVIYELTDNQVFYDSVPQITATATDTSQITFTRTGEGDKPVIAYTSENDHYLFSLIDNDYVTLEGLKFDDLNHDGDTLYYYGGILIQNSTNIQVIDCEIANFAKHGIYIEDASSHIEIQDNDVYHNQGFESPELSVYGIYANYNSEAVDLLVDGNTIYNIKSHNSSVYGIRVAGFSSQISNNMIMLNSPEKAYGLRFDGFSGKTIEAHFNTVFLTGEANQKGYGVDFEGAAGTISFSNNIVINNRNSVNDSLQLAAYVGFDGATHQFSHNIYYVINAASSFNAEFSNTYCTTIEEWQTASGTDEESKVFIPAFQDTTTANLHLDSTMALNPAMAGQYVTNVPIDYDNQNRGQLPYIGADEDATAPFPYFDIALEPASYDFGDVQLMDDTTAQINIINLLNEADNISKITTPEGYTISVGQGYSDTLTNVSLLASDTINLNVKFQPTAIQDYTGNIVITAGIQTFTVSLTGVGISPDYILSAYTLTFGEVAIHTDSIKSFYIANTSDTALDLSFTLPEDYHFQEENSSDWISEVSTTIAVDDTLAGIIRWQPHVYNFYDDTVTIESSGVDLSFDLHGRSIGVDFRVEAGLEGLWFTDSDWGDFDSDGDMDLVYSGYGLAPGKGETYIYENQGDFNFEPVEFERTGLGNTAVDWVDYDNDGDLDIFITGQDTLGVYNVFFYENDNGNFTEIRPDNILPLVSASADWADFDRDGDLDVLMTGSEHVERITVPHTKIYLNDGDGNFTEHDHNIPNVSDGDAKWADYDNDGDLDIALLGSTSESFEWITRVYKNTDGNYEKLGLELTGLRYGEVHWGDFDDDDDLDLFCNGSFSNDEGSISFILSNNGNGTFSETDLMQYGIRQGDTDWVDVDNDGDLDIIMNGIYSNALWLGRYYIYNDQKEYQLVDTLVEIKYADISFADVNGDNRLDFFLAGRYDFQDYRAYIYKNFFHLQNTKPNAPSNINVAVDTCSVGLIWDPATDPDGSAVTYNLRIGSEPGQADVFNAHVDWDGNRLVSKKGNLGTTKFVVLPCLPQGTYYASVQAVDHSYAVSEWSEEVSFEITFNDIQTLPLQNFKVYPNPSKGNVNLTFDAEKTAEYTLSINDMAGRSVYKKIENLPSGHNHIKISLPAQISQGSYILKVQSDDKQIIKMITIK